MYHIAVTAQKTNVQNQPMSLPQKRKTEKQDKPSLTEQWSTRKVAAPQPVDPAYQPWKRWSKPSMGLCIHGYSTNISRWYHGQAQAISG